MRWRFPGIGIRILFVAGFTRAACVVRCGAVVAALLTGFCLLGVPPQALGVQGRNPPPQDISFSVNGTITEKSAGKLTVDSGQNMLFTVKYDSTTQIQHGDGSPAKASELSIGVKILAKGVLTEAGDVIAKVITIESKAKSPTK